MKRLILLSFLLLISSAILYSQIPLRFNYQAAIRDGGGDILSNQNATLQITIRSGTANGSIGYREQQVLVTNEFGLVNCVIGNGTVISGAMDAPDWGGVNHFLQVEVNIGNGFVDMGTQQLLSVPHALVSNYAFSATVALDDVTDVALGTVANKNFLFYDVDHWEAGTAAETFTAGAGISIAGNTITNTGEVNGWSTTGNSGTIPGTNFIGTTDGEPLVFKVAGQKAGRIDDASPYSVGFGYQTLNSNVGFDNSALGFQSLFTNTAGNGNTANGFKALYSNSNGDFNTATGKTALFSNATGNCNTAHGYYSLGSNQVGENNTAIGCSSLESNVAGSNATAVGYRAMYYSNSTGIPFTNRNVAVGFEALFGSYPASEITGNYNTALGYQTLVTNTSGSNNTATGYVALQANTSGSSNTANGYGALNTTSSGDYNSAFGRSAYFDVGNLSNTTSLGYNAGGVVESNNRVEIGNTSVSVIAGQVAFSTYSDARIKDNVQEDVPGLDFIKKLRPVTYNLNIHRENAMVYQSADKDSGDWESKYDIEKIKMTGFLAQEVEQAAKESGYDFSGVQVPENPNDLYSLRYSDFVMPIVKAVQELNLKVEKLQTENSELKLVVEQNDVKKLLDEQQKLILSLEKKIQLLEKEFHTKN